MSKKDNLFCIFGKRKLFLLFFLGLFFMNFVSAQPVTQVNFGPNGLEIAGVDFSAIQTSTQRTAVAYVFNISNGVPMSSGLFCEFRVYKVGEAGSLVYTNQSPTQINNSFYFGIPNSVYTTTGEYTRVIQCNTSSQGGYYKSSFIANRVGQELDTPQAILYVGVLAILIFLFLVSLYGGLEIEFQNQRGNDDSIISVNWRKYLKIFSLSMSYLFLVSIIFVIWNITYAFSYWANLQIFFKYLFYVSLGLALPIFILIVVLSVAYWLHDLKIESFIKRTGVGYRG